jgi:hypothetical protein
MPKLFLRLNKAVEVDLDEDTMLKDDLIQEMQKKNVTGDASKEEIHDAVRALLKDDVNLLIETDDITADDFEIEVSTDTIINVPEPEEDEIEEN